MDTLYESNVKINNVPTNANNRTEGLISDEICRNRISFKIKDKNGKLYFTKIEIKDMPECQKKLESLKEYLLANPLEEINVSKIRSSLCNANGQCGKSLACLVHEYQQMFTSKSSN